MSDAKQPHDGPPGTVRVRIAVGVTPDGGWYARGIYGGDDRVDERGIRAWGGDDVTIRWVEADVPLPAIKGRVVG